MPKFGTDEIKKLMDDLPNVRNVMMIGPMQSGKTCGVDCLGAQCGLVGDDKIGEARFSHVRQDEREKGCSIKSNVTSMVIDDGLFHVMDTPGHVEYSAELTVACPISDGAIAVVDGGAGSLASAMSQQIKMLNNWAVTPILMCNRLDIPLVTTKKSAEEIVDNLTRIVEQFNVGLQINPPATGPFKVDATDGSVLFGSLSQGWAFTIPQLAETYANKFQCSVEQMSARMWGDYYYNAKTKGWTQTAKEGAVRGSVQLVITPLLKLLEACEGGDVAKVEKMMTGLGVALGAADKKFEGALLFKRCLQLWLPAGQCMAKAMKKFIPNPQEAQAKRWPLLIQGPKEDPAVAAVKDCKKTGTLLCSVIKLMPQPASNGRFYGLARVFSGSLGADRCFLLDEDYLPPHAREALGDAGIPMEAGTAEDEAAATVNSTTPESTPNQVASTPPAKEEGAPGAAKSGSKGSLPERRIQGVVTCCAKTFTAIPAVPAGNICAVGGIDQFVTKRCTIAGSKDSFPFRKMAFAVSPVVRVSLSPTNAKDLPKMVESLRRLSKSCPLAEISLEDSGKHVVAGCGEEHMRMLRKDLEGEYLPGVPLKWDDPSVTYKETATCESSQTCLSKSPNKHNRLYVKAEPLDEKLNIAIEAQRVQPQQEQKARAKILEKEFDWDKTQALKIWGFGPAPEESGAAYGANILVDETKGIQYLNEIRESVNSGLLWATKQGPLCEENMRGIRFNLLDCKLHADSIHRGMGQIQPTARRVMYAALLTGGARLVEPVFNVTIDAAAEALPGIMQALGGCRGELVLSEDLGERVSVQAYVPIAETIGSSPFATVLSQKTNGKAAASFAFDHWETVASDPMEVDKKTGKALTKGAEIMMQIRARKDLKVEAPLLTDYLDKL